MIIEKLTKNEIYYMETDEGRFTRHSADSWTETMGESEEQVYYCEELESAFQIELMKQNKVNDNN